MAEDTDITQSYNRVRSLMVDFLFSLNKQVVSDTAVMLADKDLLDEHRTFVEELQQARRTAIADLCVQLSVTGEEQNSYPPVAVRYWLLGRMKACEAAGDTAVAWHGYKYVEQSMLMFEERFENRVFGD